MIVPVVIVMMIITTSKKKKDNNGKQCLMSGVCQVICMYPSSTLKTTLWG